MAVALVWTEAVVESFCDITPTVREFILRPSGGALSHAPGGHLQLQIQVNGRPHTRSYSLVGAPDPQVYRIAVKRLDDGRGGSLAMWRLSVGDRLRVTEPQNHFPLDLQAPAYLLVAGGIGVTPLVCMAQTLARRGAQVRMRSGARTEAELAYGDDLRAALGDRWVPAVAEKGERVDFAAEIAALPPGGQLYICGPAAMLDAARQAWMAAGRPEADLRYETFGSSGRYAPQPFGVKVPRHGVDITVPTDSSLLDALELAGVPALHNCRRGECGLCAMDVLAVDGEIDHRDVFLSDHEKQQNHRICVCVSRVVGSVTLDSAWRPDR
ncbi:MAG: PDR/VanB family oxidoreductase [Burkholderiales bacterium]|nr:PDR/VanB family oxidoreductase [Burkholderiales bacterium]